MPGVVLVTPLRPGRRARHPRMRMAPTTNRRRSTGPSSKSLPVHPSSACSRSCNSCRPLTIPGRTADRMVLAQRRRCSRRCPTNAAGLQPATARRRPGDNDLPIARSRCAWTRAAISATPTVVHVRRHPGHRLSLSHTAAGETAGAKPHSRRRTAISLMFKKPVQPWRTFPAIPVTRIKQQPGRLTTPSAESNLAAMQPSIEHAGQCTQRRHERPAVIQRTSPGATRHQRLRQKLTKPRIISLLLVVTLAPMFLAGPSAPSAALILWTLLGGFPLPHGRQYHQPVRRPHIDHVMVRTCLRPLPAGRMTPNQVLIFGILLSAVSFFQLWWTVNLLSAVLALIGILFMLPSILRTSNAAARRTS